MSWAWCPGGRRAIPGGWNRTIARCPRCGIICTLRRGCLPDHRQRPCLAPGCSDVQSAEGLCARHNRDVNERDPLLDGFEIPKDAA